MKIPPEVFSINAEEKRNCKMISFNISETKKKFHQLKILASLKCIFLPLIQKVRLLLLPNIIHENVEILCRSKLKLK